jgi:hypothetical protein
MILGYKKHIVIVISNSMKKENKKRKEKRILNKISFNERSIMKPYNEMKKK